MIQIDGRPLEAEELMPRFSHKAPEREILKILLGSQETYHYDSLEQLLFELTLRGEIIHAANALYKSGMGFEVFRNSRCNEEFWERRRDGGFALRKEVKPADAIRDIFKNGRKYGTECATAMMILYYKALLEVFGDEAFNRLFPQIYLMNWHKVDPLLREVGLPHRAKDYLPGDRRYFANPDVNPETPQWQGENVIDLGGGIFYGHGVGRNTADYFINALNGNRKEDAGREAYLMDKAARPDFSRLYIIYQRDTVPRGEPEPAGSMA